MNTNLTYEIAKHILASLCVVKADFVNQAKAISIMDPYYLLKEKLAFNFDGEIVSNNVYGCQTNIGDKEFRMILADCTIDKETPEHCLFVELQDSPSYCVFFSEHAKDDTLIATNMTKKFWLPCPIDLQGTFLASMECIKSLAHIWSRCTKYTDQYKRLQSFIEYHDEYCSDEQEAVPNEGQEI
jgi:hypothetical protein